VEIEKETLPAKLTPEFLISIPSHLFGSNFQINYLKRFSIPDLTKRSKQQKDQKKCWSRRKISYFKVWLMKTKKLGTV
jgi:hypothetical protein